MTLKTDLKCCPMYNTIINGGTTNDKPPSGLLVCQLLMSLLRVSTHNFSFAFPALPLCHIFISWTISQLQTYQLPKEIYSLNDVTQGNRIFNSCLEEREVDFLGKCTISEVQGRNVHDWNATAELTDLCWNSHNLWYNPWFITRTVPWWKKH